MLASTYLGRCDPRALAGRSAAAEFGRLLGRPNASIFGTSFGSEDDLCAEAKGQRGVVRLVFVVDDLQITGQI